ncbi:hypothetical protein NJ75_02451 [Novosphingobium subterraneum]|uniref:Uncharacterized protein n=1 Tax=Novosphingobium subterraneum TaxID=48936 RepID=A0A0B9A5F4_9SPHN|nr:hypothetical protein NJ75_02451 [Novosphingobium subterraneum]
MIRIASIALAAGLALLGGNAAAMDAAVASQLCLDSRIRANAARLIGEWSQSYPFARVIIGDDGRFGDVGIPSPAVTGASFVVCGASYNLVKTGRDGRAFRVSIDRFYFRVTDNGSGYQVSLEDLPATLDGTTMTSRELIGRFKIDGRPYTDILAENQRRIGLGQ